jgi:hypothetical protein
MILIDSNSLILLTLGLINQELISKHKRTSIYTKKDFEDLLLVIKDLNNLVVLPNIWTEVDNILNRLSGNYKWPYIENLKALVTQTTENYLESKLGINSDYFISVGLTDSLILELGKKCDLLITSDSTLSDIAIANGIKVYDIVKKRNQDFN